MGHIVSAGFSRMYNDELLSSINPEIRDPFNLSLGSVVYAAANKEFADLVLRSVDEEDELYQSVSASWELGFNEYVIAAGSKKLREAEIITNPKHVGELSQHLRAFDGEGKMKDGTPLYRLVVGEVFPLGIGFTANPAADVKGLYVHDDKKKDRELDEEGGQATTNIALKKHFFKKNEKNISQNENLNVNTSINNISTMEKQQLLEDFRAILDEKMPEHQFSQEIVANVGRVIGDAIKSKSEQYEAELLALEEQKKQFEDSEQKMKEELDSLKSELQAAQEKFDSVQKELEQIKSDESFNARMAEIDSIYDLSEQDREVLASEVQSLDLEENSFEEYKTKVAVVWAHKNKEYLAEQEKVFEARLAEELEKRMTQTSTASVAENTEVEQAEASEEQEEDVLENIQEEQEIVANNNSSTAIKEPSLREKFSKAFSKENIQIKL